MESKEEVTKSQIAIRCAKAAILLHALTSSPYRCSSNTSGNEQLGEEEEEEETMLVRMRKEIGDLKTELAKERARSKRIRLCGLMELVLQVMLVLTLSTFFLVLVVMSP